MNTANLGAMVVRLAMEMAGFKEGWSDAARTSEAGAKRIEDSGKTIQAASDHVSTALTRQAAAFGVVAGAVALVAKAYREGSSEQDAFFKSVVMTGNAAGTTTDQLAMMAKGISAVVGTQANAASALAVMAGTGKVANANLEQFSLTAIKMERTVGISVGETAKNFAALADAPVKASLKLNESLNYLTESTYKQIKAAEVLGRTQEAGEIAQRAYDAAMSERTKRLEANLGSIERGWIAVKDTAAKAWDMMLGIGRASPLEAQIDAQRKAVDAMRQSIKKQEEEGRRPLGQDVARMQAAEGLLERQLEQLKIGRRAADIQGELVQKEQARVAWAQVMEGSLSKQDKLTRDLEKVTAQANAANASEDERKIAIAAVYERYAEKARKEPDLALKEAKRVAEERQQLRIKEDADIAKFFLHQEDLAIKASKLQQELQVKHQAEYQKGLDAQIRKATEAVASAQAEYDAYGRSKSAVAELTLAKLEEERVSRMMTGQWGRELEAIDAQIGAQKKLIDIFKKGEVREAFDKNAKDIADKLQRTQEQFYEGLMNSAMQGGKSLWEYLKGLSRSAALRIVLDPVISPLSAAVASLSAGVGGGGGASPLGLLGTGASWLAQQFGINLPSVGSLLGVGASAAGTGSYFLGTMAAAQEAGMAGTVLSKAALDGTTAFGANSIPGAANVGGMSAGAMGAYAMVAYVAAQLFKDSLGEERTGGQYGYSFDGKSAYSPRRGTYTSTDEVGATFLEGPSGGIVRDEKGNDLAAGLLNATVNNINSLFKGLGTDISITGFQAGYESSDKARGGIYSGLTLSTGQKAGEAGTGSNYQNPQGTQPLFEPWMQNGVFTTSLSPQAAAAALDMDLKTLTMQALQSAANMAPTIAVTQQEDWQQAGEDNGYFQVRDVFSRVFDSAAVELETIPKSIRDMLRGVDLEGLSDKGTTDLFNKINKTINDVAALNRLLDQMPLDLLAKQSFDVKNALIQIAGGVEVLAANLGTYYSNFYSQAEQQAQAVKNLSASFKALGLPMIDLTQGNDAARAAFRELVESQDLSTESGQKAYAGLIALAGAFASLTPVLDQASKAAQDAADAAQALNDRQDKAYAALQRAIDAAQEVKQEAIDSLRGLFDMLGDEVTDLRGEVASTRSARGAGGRQFIDQALATMRATGYAPDPDQLADAIAGARADLDPTRYASEFEYERDTLVLAGKLEQLQGLTGEQLSTAEQELEYLDSLERSAEQQYNVLRGIEDNTLDLSVALQEWIDSQKAGKAPAASAAKPATPGGAVFGGGSNMGGGADQPSNAKYKRAVSLGTAGWADRDVLDPTEIAGLDELAKIYRGFDGTGDLAGLLTAVKEAGYRLTDLQAVTGFAYVDWLNAANSVGIQAFAMGGSFAGGARIVGERGPELEITGPSRIYSAEQTRAMFGGSGALAEVMREANLDRRAEALATLEQLRRQTKLLEHLERWETIGMPRERALL